MYSNRRAPLEAEELRQSPGALGDGSMKREHSAQDPGCTISTNVRVAVMPPSCMQLCLLLLLGYECR